MRAAVVVASLALALPATACACSGFAAMNGHKLHYVCTGAGSPTVVLEAGFSLDATTWSAVLGRAAGTGTRVCAYDRLGRGRSRGTPGTRRIAAVAADLDGLIRMFQPPVVLVGHSLGGMISRYEQMSHPVAVAGLVLIESAPDDLSTYTSTPVLNANGESIDIAGASATLERFDGSTSHPLGRRPLVVIRARSEGPNGPPGFQPWWNEQQRRLAGYSSNATLAVAEHSDHFVHTEQPGLVVYAIRVVVKAVRTQTRVAPCPTWPAAKLGASCP